MYIWRGVIVERVNKIFIRENVKFIKNKKKINNYYLLSEMFRKELLSDILEYESILTESIIMGLDLNKMSAKEFILNKRYFNSEKSRKLINTILIKNNTKENMPMSKSFNSFSFGNKIKIIKNLNHDILFIILSKYLVGYDEYLSHIKFNKKILDLYLFPIFEYMKNIRNRLSHTRFNLDIFLNLNKSYVYSKKKYKMNKIILMVDNQLCIIHNKKFINRLWNKVKRNKKVSNKIFKEILKFNKINI